MDGCLSPVGQLYCQVFVPIRCENAKHTKWN